MDISSVTSNVSAEFLAPPGVPPWAARREAWAQAVRMAAPDVIALQEATPGQIADVQARLPEYAALTVPMANADPAMLAAWREKYARYGLETPPDPYELVLLYRTAGFECVDEGHWWLSPTPVRPSIGFGNVAPRVMLWARLRARATGQAIVVFNTHIDHRCPDAMVALCRQRLAGMRLGTMPRLWAGDFNFNPATENFRRLLADGWRDAAEGAPEAATFRYNLPGIPSGRIDHILYQGEGLEAAAWGRLAAPEPGMRLSDHDPVWARLRWG
jgi:endonuclease/exonuclease/phosphatase family metal-dependent hydrolase